MPVGRRALMRSPFVCLTDQLVPLCRLKAQGAPGAVLDSNTYIRSLPSKTMPRTVVRPSTATFIWPFGVIFKILEEPRNNRESIKVSYKEVVTM